MYIHKFLKQLNSGEGRIERGGFLQNLSSWIWSSSGKDFYYNVAGMSFTLEEMKHGVLRGNRKKPGAILRTLGKRDPRVFFPD